MKGQGKAQNIIIIVAILIATTKIATIIIVIKITAEDNTVEGLGREVAVSGGSTVGS